MQTVEDAQQTILKSVDPVGTERLFLGDAAGRVVSHDIVSRRNLPPRDNSAMDGYGVRAEDISTAGEEAPKTLRVVGRVLAGAKVADERPVLASGDAVRIMTGAPIPPGVDAVIMRENTDESGVHQDSGMVRINVDSPAGTAIRKCGEDIKKGNVVAPSGTRITPPMLNLIASAGHSVVDVARKPVVAILASGDELKELGSIITPDDIVNSNAHAIGAATERLGAVAQRVGIAKDTLDDHVQRIKDATFADVLVTIGGVSMGTHDFVRPALEAVGAELSFWKVAMRPGKPLAFGRRGKQLVFGLPGNPVSSLVSFILFVAPALRRMMGEQDVRPRPLKARLVGDGHRSRDDVAFYARATLVFTDDGAEVTLSPKQSSGQISGLATANCLAINPRGNQHLNPGDMVDVLPLEGSALFGVGAL